MRLKSDRPINNRSALWRRITWAVASQLWIEVVGCTVVVYDGRSSSEAKPWEAHHLNTFRVLVIMRVVDGVCRCVRVFDLVEMGYVIATVEIIVDVDLNMICLLITEGRKQLWQMQR